MMTDTSTRANSTVYVGGLDPVQVNSAVLTSHFVPFGEITSVSLPKPEAPSSTDLHRGFGYVEFEEASDAKEAIDNMDQSELCGKVIKVAMAKPDVRREGGEAGKGVEVAIWEREGWNAGEDAGEAEAEGDEVEKPDPMRELELGVEGPREG